jgi:imidazole glycerol-phosphate synthase subunit HisH
MKEVIMKEIIDRRRHGQSPFGAKALENVGANVERTDDPQKVLAAKKVVLPGVGAFGDFMDGMKAKGLDDAVKQVVSRGVPMLGICVGMQALFEIGEEMGEHEGLGLLRGTVVKFADTLSVKIPHTGWNQLTVKKEARSSIKSKMGRMSISITRITVRRAIHPM